MTNGKFLNFYLPYMVDNKRVDSSEQALQIIGKAQQLLKQGYVGVAITYSANDIQTADIEKDYSQGKWITGISGLNQAEVISNMEDAEKNPPYNSLQGKLRIAPITTTGYSDFAMNHPNQWLNTVLPAQVDKYLANIKNYLTNGWCVLGWQNQKTINYPTAPYAIGGGVTALPTALNQKIQSTLMDFAKQFA